MLFTIATNYFLYKIVVNAGCTSDGDGDWDGAGDRVAIGVVSSIKLHDLAHGLNCCFKGTAQQFTE